MAHQGRSLKSIRIITCACFSNPLATLLMLEQFIFRSEIGDAYLGTVSRFMTNAFEYGDALLPDELKAPPPPSSEVSANTPSTASSVASNQPYLNKAT